MVVKEGIIKTVSIIGSTGVIGRKSVEIISRDIEQYKIFALTAGRNFKLLAEQARILKPEIVVIADCECYKLLKRELPSKIKILVGDAGLEQAVSQPVDWIIFAITGFVALYPITISIKHCKVLALANKEALVCAGSLIMQMVKQYNIQLIPVDSEHNAIFQILWNNDSREQIESITLTASGGPFRQYTRLQMKDISPKQALRHPVWRMGPKITIDSATMMNKGLEMIEAYHLFSLDISQIKTVIHPESIIHGMVNFCDGSAMAVLSNPDMEIPISNALTWPQRKPTSVPKLDLTEIATMNFFALDYDLFPTMKMAIYALEQGHNYPIALNAANEIAVQAFLSEQIG